MAKKKDSKNKKKSVQKEDYVDIEGPHNLKEDLEAVEKEKQMLTFVDNSFPACVNSITGIPAKTFGDIQSNIERVGYHDWHKPYVEVLKQHGYDMIFFSYEQPVMITTETPLESYMFNQLPTGKCILLGRDSSNNFKCCAGSLNDSHNAKILYDPCPESSFVEIINVGFFIKTFFEYADNFPQDDGDE